MTRATTPGEEQLIALVAATARGPSQDGLFAVWLVLRAAEGLLPPGAVSGRNHRRRLQALKARLGGLALAAPLRRALDAACHHLGAATPAAAAIVLSQLVAPAREVLGAAAGEAVAIAARSARIHL